MEKSFTLSLAKGKETPKKHRFEPDGNKEVIGIDVAVYVDKRLFKQIGEPNNCTMTLSFFQKETK